MPIVLKSGSLRLLVLSGPVQVCNGIALKEQTDRLMAKMYTERKQNDEMCVPIRVASKILCTNGVVLMADVFHTYLRYADKWLWQAYTT